MDLNDLVQWMKGNEYVRFRNSCGEAEFKTCEFRDAVNEIESLKEERNKLHIIALNAEAVNEMERKTYRLESGATNLVGILEANNPAQKAKLRQNGWESLAQYEDTNLTPEQIESLKEENERLKSENELLKLKMESE